jgi:formylglycine-generating enzyme required for sulfatase activity
MFIFLVFLKSLCIASTQTTMINHPDSKDFSVEFAQDGPTLRMVYISGGTFSMGIPSNPNLAGDSMSPTSATVSGFWISRTEITNEMYRCFDPQHSSGQWEGIDFDGDRQPVVNIIGREASAFCRWLSSKADRQFELPSEAQ